jgi:hypothetical protein
VKRGDPSIISVVEWLFVPLALEEESGSSPVDWNVSLVLDQSMSSLRSLKLLISYDHTNGDGLTATALA